MRFVLFFTAAICAAAQPNPGWTAPFPAHRIVGNLYYVGTYDLTSYLIATPQGNIIINTGLEGSAALIQASVESLGFHIKDTKILLCTHAHYDHTAAMAEMKRMTGARFLASEPDVPVFEDGGRSDYLFTDPKLRFEPVQVDGRLKDGQKISLGGTELTVYSHPGHTRGSVSYGLTIAENGRNYRVLIANMGSINPGTLLVGNRKYPQIADDYARTFRSQKALECDIFLSSHASQYHLHDKWKPGQAYSPETFVDPEGYKAAVANAEANYLEWLAKEKQ